MVYREMKKNILNKCFKNKDGKTVFVQAPNLPIILWISTVILKMFTEGKYFILLDYVGFGVLFTWAWLEIFNGVNYFRRITGSIVLAFLIYTRVY